MKIDQRFKVLSFFLVAAYLLTACGGALSANALTDKGPKVQENIVAFTGIVETIQGDQWTVGGQTLALDSQTSLDPNIAVGDEVKVKARVTADGAVVALKVESSRPDDSAATPSVEVSSTPDPVATSSPDTGSTPVVNSMPDASTSPAAGANENEIFGTIQTITANAITVDDVTYSLTSLTEIKDALRVGDQVKVHVTLNADGTATVREIEKSVASAGDNSSVSGSNDGPNHDLIDDHSNGSSTEDGPNHDSNDDHGGSSGSGGSSGDD